MHCVPLISHLSTRSKLSGKFIIKIAASVAWQKAGDLLVWLYPLRALSPLSQQILCGWGDTGKVKGWGCPINPTLNLSGRRVLECTSVLFFSLSAEHKALPPSSTPFPAAPLPQTEEREWDRLQTTARCQSAHSSQAVQSYWMRAYSSCCS